MKVKHLIIFGIVVTVAAISLYHQNSVIHLSLSKQHADNCNESCCQKHHVKLEDMTLEEVVKINRRLSSQIDEDFRSWRFDEPERWVYLSKKFVEEIKLANPELTFDEKTVSEIFIKYLEDRTKALHADSKEKLMLARNAAAEFKYNLSFELGIEGLNSWQRYSQTKIIEYNQLRDSLLVIIATQTKIKKKLGII